MFLKVYYGVIITLIRKQENLAKLLKSKKKELSSNLLCNLYTKYLLILLEKIEISFSIF